MSIQSLTEGMMTLALLEGVLCATHCDGSYLHIISFSPHDSSLKTVCVCVCVSCSVMSNSLQPQGPQTTRLLCLWNSPGKNTGVGCLSLLQGIFPTQGSNLGLPHCRQIPYHLGQQGSLLIFIYTEETQGTHSAPTPNSLF